MLEQDYGSNLSRIKCTGISKGSRLLNVNLGEVSNKDFSQVDNKEIVDLSTAISSLSQSEAILPTPGEFVQAHKSILRAKARIEYENEQKKTKNLRDKANSEVCAFNRPLLVVRSFTH